MKDLKSPDSYDSGIQTDSVESNNWNMYGVVKKSKRFPSSNSDLQTNSMNEEEWGYYNDGDFHQTGNGRFAYSSNTIPDSNRKLSPMMENQVTWLGFLCEHFMKMGAFHEKLVTSHVQLLWVQLIIRILFDIQYHVIVGY